MRVKASEKNRKALSHLQLSMERLPTENMNVSVIVVGRSACEIYLVYGEQSTFPRGLSLSEERLNV